jgi:hypothetical protein
MRKNPVILTISCIAFLGLLNHAAFGESLDIAIEGDADSAPIYLLNGTADTTFLVDGDINVDGSFIFSMDDAASPNVFALGDYHVTSWDWDADLQASSTYKISSYRNIIKIAFNHLCEKKPGGRLLMDGYECETGQILSKGVMYLVASDPYFLSGGMGGYVRGQVGGRTIKNCKYKNVAFTQSIDVATADWGDWEGIWSLTTTGSKISGTGTIQIGPDSDPVETVAQTVKGTVKKGIFSWSAAGAGADKKVQVKITNTNSDLVDNKSSVSAAAQTRKF